MEKHIFEPTRTKILTYWLIFAFVCMVFVLIFIWTKFSDPILIIILGVVILFQNFVLTIIFFNLPYFKIEISKSNLIGPNLFGVGWKRSEIPIVDIDLQNVGTSFHWFGVYVIKSSTGGRIDIWGFDETQFKKFMEILLEIRRKQNNLSTG